MTDFTIVIPDLEPLLADVTAAGGNAQPLADAAAQNSAREIQALARQKAPHRTGNLQRSILVETPAPSSAMVTVNEIYGTYVEEGTGLYHEPDAHTRWKGNIPGVGWRWIRGMHARPYFAPAVQESMDFIQAQFTLVYDRLTKELAGRL